MRRIEVLLFWAPLEAAGCADASRHQERAALAPRRQRRDVGRAHSQENEGHAGPRSRRSGATRWQEDL
eukprot:29189-Pyramimonas_sp.AAC.1